MYGWIWNHLPGNNWIKAGCSAVLIVGIAALLWFVAFPAAEPHLPFYDSTVEGDSELEIPYETEAPDDLPYDTGEGNSLNN